MGKYDELLRSSLESLDIHLDDGQFTQLHAYIAELELWNPTHKLVGSKGEELITRHIVDSLSGLPVIQEFLEGYGPSARVADLGSGSGLPGIPLAIALKEYHFTLIERMGRRVGFLRNALAMCRLTDRVEVVDKDLREVEEQFPVITFRAFRPFSEISDLLWPILTSDGVVCAYKGQGAALDEELVKLEEVSPGRWSSRRVPLQVPHLDAERMLCILQKN